MRSFFRYDANSQGDALWTTTRGFTLSMSVKRRQVGVPRRSALGSRPILTAV